MKLYILFNEIQTDKKNPADNLKKFQVRDGNSKKKQLRKATCMSLFSFLSEK